MKMLIGQKHDHRNNPWAILTGAHRALPLPEYDLQVRGVEQPSARLHFATRGLTLDEKALVIL